MMMIGGGDSDSVDISAVGNDDGYDGNGRDDNIYNDADD